MSLWVVHAAVGDYHGAFAIFHSYEAARERYAASFARGELTATEVRCNPEGSE